MSQLPPALEAQVYRQRIERARQKTAERKNARPQPVANQIDLTAFKRRLYHRYLHGRHLEALDRTLEQVTRYIETGGKEGIGRIIIAMPPRYGKTITTARYYPAWHIGRNPEHRIMLLSYGASLAEKSSRVVRNLIRSKPYQDIYPGVQLARDSKAVDAWDIEGREGGMDALGMDGAATGKGAHLMIIDDPIKNRQEAESLHTRDRVWDTFTDDLYTRLEPGGAVIIMATRWHMDDLSGRLLKRQPDRWRTLVFKALAEENDPLGRAAGEPLWAERYPLESVLDTRATIGNYGFSAEYQQDPKQRDGNMIKRSWLKVIPAIPADVKIVGRLRYWDKAATAGGTGARTAGVKMALASDGRVFIEKGIAGWWSSAERREVMKQTAIVDGRAVKIYIEQEPGSSGKDSVESDIRDLQGFSAHRDLPTGDKDIRLEPFAAQAEIGNIFIVEGEWVEDYIEEMTSIPNGARRDYGDATAAGFNKLTLVNRGFSMRVMSSGS